jgi:hypothetical protein
MKLIGENKNSFWNNFQPVIALAICYDQTKHFRKINTFHSKYISRFDKYRWTKRFETEGKYKVILSEL